MKSQRLDGSSVETTLPMTWFPSDRGAVAVGESITVVTLVTNLSRPAYRIFFWNV